MTKLAFWSILIAIITACALLAGAAPVEIWLSRDRAAQLKAITSRPYVTGKKETAPGVEEIRWTNGGREWTTTQAVRRVTGAKAKNPHAAARREAAEARAEADALLADIKALGLKTRVTPADVKAVAEKHEKQRGKPAPKKEKNNER